MQTAIFDYPFPPELIATQPSANYRILLGAAGENSPALEINLDKLFELFQPGDLLVLNDTRVVKRRVFAGDLEILFIEENSNGSWQVLFPARDVRVGAQIVLPGGATATLAVKGLPQTLQVNQPLTAAYFAQYGEFALPPYIQKARGFRHSKEQDEAWYQTVWAAADKAGSCAAPTASLHFSKSDLEALSAKNVQIQKLTLHVGIGTFLPVKSDSLDGHKMHKEFIEIPVETIRALKDTRARGRKIWALGTTVTRALESYGQNMLTEQPSGAYAGESDLFIRPGYEWQWVDALMTNFHQPKSTLMAMVAAFAGLENVLASYAYAVDKRFRLFSYGDLSVWQRHGKI